MGNIISYFFYKKSVIQSPYSILQVTPYHSLREIKLSYLNLMKKNQKPEYNTAYALIKESPPPLNLYSNLSDDVIEKINQFAKTDIPPINSSEYKQAYRMLSRLNISNFRTDNDRIHFYFHLSRLINKSKKEDERLILKKRHTAKNKTVSKVLPVYGPFLICEECNKKFKGINTFKDHLKSKKHKENTNFKEEIVIEKKKQPVKNTAKDKVVEVEESIVQNKVSNHKLDHLVFRTCSFCKEVFDTRVLLLYHLRSNHKKGSS